MEFKKLDIKPEGSWIKKTLESKHTKKTMIYIILGAVAGLIYFYFAQDKQIADFTASEIIKSMVIGGFFGFFITNSPCARGRC